MKNKLVEITLELILVTYIKLYINAITLILQSIDFDDCLSNPCQNGGTCQDEINSYTCNCTAGFTGHDCEIGIQR